MIQIHVECLPDELLVKRLNFAKKSIIHHTGKSRVFKKLQNAQNQLAMVDEDPGSAKTHYEIALMLVEEQYGIKFYKDNTNNKIFVLRGKLEDWIIYVCKRYKIKLLDFNLPENPNDLHDIINHRLDNFGQLIDYLLKSDNPAILQLKNYLKKS